MKYNQVSRRMFLQGVGGATLAIPFLPSLANAQVAAPDQYFILFPFNNGVIRHRTWPVSNVPFTQIDANTKMRRLADIVASNGKISEIFGTNWNAYANQMNIITGMNLYSRTNEHTDTSATCAMVRYAGFGDSKVYPAFSADHIIKSSWAKKGYKPAIPHIPVVIGKNDEYGEYSSFSFGIPDPENPKFIGHDYNHYDNSKQLEQIIFGAQSPTSPTDPGVVSRRKLVDAVIGDYRRVVNDPRLSALDKNRFQNAMDLWNDIQNRSQVISACSMPAALGGNPNYTLQNRQVVDLLTAALSCGITRVVSHGMIQHGDTFLGDAGAHGVAHDNEYITSGPAFAWRMAFMKQYADRLSSLITATGEPLMKKSLLFMTTEYSEFGLHPQFGRTVITLGEAGGAIKAGYHVSTTDAPIGRAHITAMKAMGVTTAEIEATTGSVGYGEYTSDFKDVTGDVESDERLIQSTKNTAEYTWRKSNLSKFSTDVEKRKPVPGLLTAGDT